MEDIGDILCYGDLNYYWPLIVTVYFDATVQAIGPINTHRVLFFDGFYDMICMLFSSIFDSKTINNK